MPSKSHGLSSRNAILPMEAPAEFQALLDGFRDVFQPANAFQESCLRELACLDWRLRPVARIEAGILVYRVERARETEKCRDTAPKRHCSRRKIVYDQDTRLLGISFYRDCEDNAFVKLNRYENSLRRAYYKALKELQSPKRPRNAEPQTQSQFPPPEPPAVPLSPEAPSPDPHHTTVPTQSQFPPPEPPPAESAYRREAACRAIAPPPPPDPHHTMVPTQSQFPPPDPRNRASRPEAACRATAPAGLQTLLS